MANFICFPYHGDYKLPDNKCLESKCLVYVTPSYREVEGQYFVF